VIAEQSLKPLVSFPVVLIYAMPMAIPFGTVAAVFATILFNVLSLPSWRPSSKGAWIFIGSAVGLLLGGLFPFFLTLVGFGPDSPTWRLHWAIEGAVAGSAVDLFSGGLVGEKLIREEPPNSRLEKDLRPAVFMHPENPAGTELMGSFGLRLVCGNPADTTFSLGVVIYSGACDRFPNLELCTSHGGGFSPITSAGLTENFLPRKMPPNRADRPDAQRCTAPPNVYFKTSTSIRWFMTSRRSISSAASLVLSTL
jgi:hypothetical protein